MTLSRLGINEESRYKTQFPSIATVDGCATQCLQDAACTQFVWSLEGG